MERKKAFHLLTLVFSLLMIEKSMVSPVLAQNYPFPDDDNSRSKVNGSPATMDRDKIWDGNSSDGHMVQVPPPATKTKIEYSSAVSPTSNTSSSSVNSSGDNSRTSVSSSSNNSSSTVTRGGATSKSSSTHVENHSSSSSRGRGSGVSPKYYP